MDKGTDKAFELIKRKILILHLPNSDKVSKVVCYASHVGIGGVLSQGGHPITYLSEKLRDAKKRNSAYDVDFYALAQALKHR